MNIRLLATVALFALALPAAAQTMKPGLWEMSHKMRGSAEMDQAMAEMQKQLAQMPPEQRKQMEAAMGKHGVKMMPGTGGSGGMVVQMCMTREMVERQDVPMDKGCTASQQKRTGNSVHYTFTCSNPPSSGEGDVTYTPEGYTSTSTIKTMVQGKPETMTMEGRGRWLKADCGDVKPPPQPAKK